MNQSIIESEPKPRRSVDFEDILYSKLKMKPQICHPDAQGYHYVDVNFNWDDKTVVFGGESRGHWEDKIEEHGGPHWLRGELIDGGAPVTYENKRVWVKDEIIYPPETFDMPEELKSKYPLNDDTRLHFDSAATGRRDSAQIVLCDENGEVKYFYSYMYQCWRSADNMKTPLKTEFGSKKHLTSFDEKLKERSILGRKQGLSYIQELQSH